MKTNITISLLAVTLMMLGGCVGGVISKQYQKDALDAPFEDVRKNVSEYEGETVVWGGIIAGVKNQEDQSTIEVVQSPVDDGGVFYDTDNSAGRFLAKSDKFLDPVIYERGRMISIAGRITGKESRQLDERTFTYPIVEILEMYLWRENEMKIAPYYYYDPIYPNYYYRDMYPYWNYPPYLYPEFSPYYPYRRVDRPWPRYYY